MQRLPNFQANATGGCIIWAAVPSQQQAHESISARLSTMIGGGFLPVGTKLSVIQFGNMGEFLSLFVGEDAVTYLGGCHCVASNALNPLNPISISGVDLIWAYFGNTESEDRLYIQEVKTTGQPGLGIANSLVDDYEKLFTINPHVNLKNRVSLLKAKMITEWNLPDLAPRCSKFIGIEPNECSYVTILPTLVFDTNQTTDEDVVNRLVQVRTTLIGDGWNSHQIEMFGIGLDELTESLSRLACGQI